jgi:hypothetical protein
LQGRRALVGARPDEDREGGAAVVILATRAKGLVIIHKRRASIILTHLGVRRESGGSLAMDLFQMSNGKIDRKDACTCREESGRQIKHPIDSLL